MAVGAWLAQPVGNASGNLTIALLFVACGVASILFGRQGVAMWRRIERDGRVIPGEITAFAKTSRGLGHMLTMHYRMTPPDGIARDAVASWASLRLPQPLPAPGTRIAVYYADPEHHAAL